MSRSAGRHRATGLRHAATIQVAVPSASALYSGWRHRAEDCDDILSSLVASLRCARWCEEVARSSRVAASSRKLRWHPAIAVVASRHVESRIPDLTPTRSVSPKETAGILLAEDASEHQQTLWFRRLASAFKWSVVWPSVSIDVFNDVI